MADGKVEALLRRDADNLVTTVAVHAAEIGRDPADVLQEALADAYARLTESGVLGRDVV